MNLYFNEYFRVKTICNAQNLEKNLNDIFG